MSEGANGQGPAPADEFDRALRELTEGRADDALFHEPSAAERAREEVVRARQARTAEAKSTKRVTRRARRHLRAANGRQRRMLTGSLIVLVVLVIAGGLTWIRFGRTAGGAADVQTADAQGSHTVTMTGAATGPTSAIYPRDLFNQPPADPFSGTRAASWAAGSAGIVAPKARPVGPFTAAQVASAYTATRRLLIAAALDRATLLGGKPAAFAKLLTSQQRSAFLGSLNRTGLDKNGKERNLRSMVASFAPGGTVLIGPVIKVRGSMRAEVTLDHGRQILAVAIDYRFVYPVEPPGGPTFWMRVIAQFTGTVEFGPWAGAGTALAPWVAWSQGDAGVNCGTSDGYIHPAYQNGPVVPVRPSGSPIDPYAPRTHLGNSRCWSVTRT